jgi:hypothetical protein
MQAPSGVDLHEECVRKIHDLHKFDCLRANKATMAWGVEARVPFLDKDFLDTVGDFPLIKPPNAWRFPKLEKTIKRPKKPPNAQNPFSIPRAALLFRRQPKQADDNPRL